MTETPLAAAAANQKKAERLAAVQKAAQKKQTFWTKIKNALK